MSERRSAARPPVPGRALRLCLWCAGAAVAEIALFASYRGHDARFR